MIPPVVHCAQGKTKCFSVPFEMNEKVKKLHTLFTQNNCELLEVATASQTALNGAAAL